MRDAPFVSLMFWKTLKILNMSNFSPTLSPQELPQVAASITYRPIGNSSLKVVPLTFGFAMDGLRIREGRIVRATALPLRIGDSIDLSADQSVRVYHFRSSSFKGVMEQYCRRFPTGLGDGSGISRVFIGEFAGGGLLIAEDKLVSRFRTGESSGLGEIPNLILPERSHGAVK
jgi:hypothetical protein